MILLPIVTVCLSEAVVRVAIVVTLPPITQAAASVYVVLTNAFKELKK